MSDNSYVTMSFKLQDGSEPAATYLDEQDDSSSGGIFAAAGFYRLEYSGRISGLYRARLSFFSNGMVSSDALKALRGKAATVEISCHEPGLSRVVIRTVHGVVDSISYRGSRIARADSGGTCAACFYEVDLVSPLTVLQGQRHCRTFCGISVYELIRRLLTEHNDCLLDLAAQPDSELYDDGEAGLQRLQIFAQTDESDWDFLCRIVRMYGINLCFAHPRDQSKPTLYLSNLTSWHRGRVCDLEKISPVQESAAVPGTDDLAELDGREKADTDVPQHQEQLLKNLDVVIPCSVYGSGAVLLSSLECHFNDGRSDEELSGGEYSLFRGPYFYSVLDAERRDRSAATVKQVSAHLHDAAQSLVTSYAGTGSDLRLCQGSHLKVTDFYGPGEDHACELVIWQDSLQVELPVTSRSVPDFFNNPKESVKCSFEAFPYDKVSSGKTGSLAELPQRPERLGSYEAVVCDGKGNAKAASGQIVVFSADNHYAPTLFYALIHGQKEPVVACLSGTGADSDCTMSFPRVGQRVLLCVSAGKYYLQSYLSDRGAYDGIPPRIDVRWQERLGRRGISGAAPDTFAASLWRGSTPDGSKTGFPTLTPATGASAGSLIFYPEHSAVTLKEQLVIRLGNLIVSGGLDACLLSLAADCDCSELVLSYHNPLEKSALEKLGHGAAQLLQNKSLKEACDQALKEHNRETAQGAAADTDAQSNLEALARICCELLYSLLGESKLKKSLSQRSLTALTSPGDLVLHAGGRLILDADEVVVRAGSNVQVAANKFKADTTKSLALTTGANTVSLGRGGIDLVSRAWSWDLDSNYMSRLSLKTFKGISMSGMKISASSTLGTSLGDKLGGSVAVKSGRVQLSGDKVVMGSPDTLTQTKNRIKFDADLASEVTTVTANLSSCKSKAGSYLNPYFKNLLSSTLPYGFGVWEYGESIKEIMGMFDRDGAGRRTRATKSVDLVTGRTRQYEALDYILSFADLLFDTLDLIVDTLTEVDSYLDPTPTAFSFEKKFLKKEGFAQLSLIDDYKLISLSYKLSVLALTANLGFADIKKTWGKVSSLSLGNSAVNLESDTIKQVATAVTLATSPLAGLDDMGSKIENFDAAQVHNLL